MLDFFNSLDKQWILSLNGTHSPFWDYVMYTFSGKKIWIFLYVAIVYAIISRWKVRSWLPLVVVVLTVVFADHLATAIRDEWVQRFRPSHDLDIGSHIVSVFGEKGSLYGFVSSHAANTMGLAMITSLIFKNRIYTISIFIWSIMVSYSRIYLGVHYVFDVLGGTIVGFGFALFLYFIFSKIKTKYFNSEINSSSFHTYIPVIVLFITILSVFVLSVLQLS